MKPYDKSNSFMRRVTKRVSEMIPGTTWMNMLLGESQTVDEMNLSTENEEQPPMKKLCTPNNTFVNNRTGVDTKLYINSTDNLRNSHVHLPEISALPCVPSTSRQSSKFASQSSSSLLGHDIGTRSSSKRKSDVAELSNINRPNPKMLALNFASSTPTLDTLNKPLVSISSKRPLNSGKLSTESSNEFLTSTSLQLIRPRENESQSIVKLHKTTNNISSPSFRWDTFVNYGELSERQKLFAQKSPLNCSQVMYGGRSARSNLSKILGNTPPLHRKSVIPISPSTNSEVRTTSSILLRHISTKDKEIEENKFIIQPRMDGHLSHKANKKIVPLKVETTVKIVDATLQNSEEKSHDTLSSCFGRDTSRKLRANISKKARNLKSDEYEMPAIVNLPDISLPMSELPSIKLSNNEAEDNEFTFNQPLTLEEFGLQIVEKTSKKKQQLVLKKTQSINTDSNKKDPHTSKASSSVCEIFKKQTEKVLSTNDIKIKSDKVSELCKFGNDSKDDNPIDNSKSKLDFVKPENMVFDNSFQVLDSDHKKQQTSEKLSVELKKWTCDTCWVSNDPDKIKCVACQTAKVNNAPKPLTVSEPIRWTCETCWVPNKSETDKCVACQTQKPGSTNKIVEKCSTWTCDACWVKNKSESTSCISCSTAKPGSAPDNKPPPSTQLNFGFNNNSFEKSGSSQFKFGFVSGNTDESNNQFKFGSPAFKSSENEKTDVPATEFKFGLINNESNKTLGTIKFGIDSSMSLPVKKLNDIPYNNDTGKPLNQFKFGLENKSDIPENEIKFRTSVATSKPIAQFNLGSGDSETDKSIQQDVGIDSNKLKQSVVTNDKSEKLVVLPNKSSQFKFGDTRHVEKSPLQVTFGSIETNCSNSSVDELKNKDLSVVKCVKDKNKTENNPVMDFKMPSTVQPQDANSVQLVNGHSHANEEFKPGLIKTSQLFSFGSLAKQDQNLPDDKKKPKTFTFGSTTSENKMFVTPVLGTSFSNTGPVFGTSNSMFNSGPTVSTPVTLGSSIETPKFSFGQLASPTLGNIFPTDDNKNPSNSAILAPSVSTPKFSFGSMAPPTSNNFAKVNDKNALPQTSNSLSSKTNVGFSFGAQSPPLFSVANAGGFKPSVQSDDQTKGTSNSIFSVKQTVKLDPNAPISINFTGGATTQFTAKPETTEPPTKRKILKPVRRIR